MAGIMGPGGNISFAISSMLNANEGQIATAINKQTSMKAWIFVGAAVMAIVLIVKKMGK